MLIELVSRMRRLIDIYISRPTTGLSTGTGIEMTLTTAALEKYSYTKARMALYNLGTLGGNTPPPVRSPSDYCKGMSSF